MKAKIAALLELAKKICDKLPQEEPIIQVIKEALSKINVVELEMLNKNTLELMYDSLFEFNKTLDNKNEEIEKLKSEISTLKSLL